MKKYLCGLALVLLSLAVLAGCIPIPPVGTNHDPVINSATPNNPLEVDLNQDVDFTVVATDADGDNLSYTWTATAGTPTTGSSNTFSWTAPAQAGTVTITVSVSDGKKAVNNSWTVTVTDGGGTVNPGTTVTIEEDVAVKTTWTNDKLYVIDGDICVSSGLTIQPGTIIKFTPASSLYVTDGGQIFADAANGQPIIFTSYADDEHGGDTNEGATLPAPGDWDGIHIFSTSGSKFINCQFYYAGHDSNPALYLQDAQATITSCLFVNNLGSEGALNAKVALANTVITNNTFYNNDVPLGINCLLNLDESNTFHNPAVTTETNTHNGIYVRTYYEVVNGIEWKETEVPFVITADLTINETGALTLPSNVVFKFLPATRMAVAGTLTATNVTFTSLKDDILNDTNSDQQATKGDPGDWIGVYFDQTASGYLTDCKFFYGGHGNFPVIETYESLIFSATGCTIAHNLGDINNPALNAYWSGKNTTIKNCTFFDNVFPLGINTQYSIDNSNVFVNPNDATESNTHNGIYVNSWYGINTPISWSETDVPFVITGDLTINGDGGELVLADNVILKFLMNTAIYYTYNIVNYDGSGVWFTSYRDDLHGGNTDQTTSSPIEGEWKGICLVTDDGDEWQDWSNILFDSIGE